MDHVLRESGVNARVAHARVCLALFALAAGFFVAVTFSPMRSGFADAPDRGPGDIALYRAEVDRLKTGEFYYDAAGSELATRGYPTRSLFNWRMPLLVWLVAHLPQIAVANAILGGLGVVLVLLSFKLLADEGTPGQGIAGGLLMIGPVLPCFLGDLVLMTEIWSGVLLALSAVCYGLGRAKAAVLAGLAALFFRELAAPYVLICLALAAIDRRHRELGWWALGLAAYTIYFGLHVTQVLPRINPQAVAHQHGWFRFGGAGFLISTAQMNAYLLLVPQWVTAIYLALALVGSAGWNSVAGRRIGLTVAVYAIAFSFAGNDFNQYWGSQIAPLLCLPVARSWSSLRQLWRESTVVSSVEPPALPGGAS